MDKRTASIPEGYEFDRIDDTTKEVVFRPKPKTYADIYPDMASIFKANGTTADEFYAKCTSNELEPDEVGYRLAKMLVKTFNDNRLPDWNNSELKWYPWFWMNNKEGGSSGFPVARRRSLAFGFVRRLSPCFFG